MSQYHFCEDEDRFPGSLSTSVGTHWNCPGCGRSLVYEMGMSEDGHYAPHWYGARPMSSYGVATSVLAGHGEPVPPLMTYAALVFLAVLLVGAALVLLGV